MKYEWDDEKNASNFEKHGIRFEDAIAVFHDIYALEVNDEFHEGRTIRFGFNFYKGVLAVVYIDKDDFIRIISARKTTKSEEKQYAQRIRPLKS